MEKNKIELEGQVLGPITRAEYDNGVPIVNFKLLVQAGRRPDIFPVFAVKKEADLFADSVHEGDTVWVSGIIHTWYRKVNGAVVTNGEKTKPLKIPTVSVKAREIRLVE